MLFVKRKGVSNIFDPDLQNCAIRQPDFMFHFTINEDVRQQRMNKRGRTTNSDTMMDNEEIRTSILQQYNAMDMIEINTSYLTPEQIADKVLAYID